LGKWFLSAALLVSAGVIAAVPAAAQSPGPDRYSSTAADADHYRLGVADRLRVTVFNEPTISGEFAVGGNGALSLPLIGDVPAAGKPVDEVASAIQAALANGYLRDPKVSAEVVSFRPFFILGEVKAPGQYPYAIGLTAYNAIATAQGFSPRAERKTVYIRRTGEDSEHPFRLTPDLRILPGDTIRVGERYF
jgi:polysaccharide export outer membrane protein